MDYSNYLTDLMAIYGVDSIYNVINLFPWMDEREREDEWYLCF